MGGGDQGNGRAFRYTAYASATSCMHISSLEGTGLTSYIHRDRLPTRVYVLSRGGRPDFAARPLVTTHGPVMSVVKAFCSGSIGNVVLCEDADSRAQR